MQLLQVLSGLAGFGTDTRACLQIWEQKGGSVVNAANGYCLSIAHVPCGHLGVCNPGKDQTGTAGTILSVIAEPCSSSSQMQTWHTQLWENVQPPEFVLLNVSATALAPPDPQISAKVAASELEVRRCCWYQVRLLAEMPCWTAYVMELSQPPCTQLSISSCQQRQGFQSLQAVLGADAGRLLACLQANAGGHCLEHNTAVSRL